MISLLHAFFKKSPAILFALYVTIGTGASLYIPVLLFLIPLFFILSFRDILFGTFIVAFTFLTCQIRSASEPLPEGKRVPLFFQIEEVRPVITPYAKYTLALGTIRKVGEKNCCEKGALQLRAPLPTGDLLYIPRASLRKQQTGYRITGKPSFTHSSTTPSLALCRHTLKKKIASYIHTHYAAALPRAFLQTALTNLPHSFALSEFFGSAGLSHMIAVSGLHFSLVIGLAFFILTRITSKKGASFGALFVATMLHLYMGKSPSVLRAYEMISLYFFGTLRHHFPQILNLCGASLCISLLLSPEAITLPGMQLSYLATLGLLIIYPALFTFFVAKPPFSAMKKESFFSQLLFLASRYILSTFFLTLSATLATLPCLLYHFHTFPLSSLIYNCIFPPLLCLSLSLFLIGIIIPPLHRLNEYFLSALFIPIEYQPYALTSTITCSPSPFLAICLTAILFLPALLYREKSRFMLIPVHTS